MSREGLPTLVADQATIDLRLCLTSGQVFRWHEESPDVWVGFDGEHSARFASRREDVSGHGLAQNATLRAHEHWHRFFRLDDPLDLQSHLATMCPKFATLPRIEGFRLLRPTDPVESFFSFLCTSNNHIARITKMVNFLFPETFSGDLLPIPAFSEPELRVAGFGYRAATIPAAARLLRKRGGRDYLNQLRSATLDEARAELITFPGVGPKLADCIALYALHNTRAVPVDVHLWNGSSRLYFPEWHGTNLTAAKYQAVGDHFRNLFGPWAAHAHLFVYFSEIWSRRQSRDRPEAPEGHSTSAPDLIPGK